MRSSRLSRNSRHAFVSALGLLAVVFASWISPQTVAAQEQLGKAPSLTPESGSPNTGGTTESVVIVTVGSINELIQDINYISGAFGQAGMGQTIGMMAQMFTQGIDTTQPIGIVVPLVDGAPEPIAMIPTNDVRQVLKRLEAQAGPADELDDGTLVIAIGANTVFIRQVGNWAILARNRNVLDQAPADPASIISQMGNDYDVAVKLDMQQIPEPIRNALIGQLRQGFEQAMSRQAKDGEADSAREYGEQSIEQLTQVISQTDELMLGIDIDSPGQQVLVDVSFTALPGTKLATIYDGQKPIPSVFSSVVRDNAAAYFHAAGTVGPETVEQAKANIDNGLNMLSEFMGQTDKFTDEEKVEASAVIKRIADLVMSSYEEGKFDAGGVVLTDANQLQAAMGLFVSDGNEAATIVKDIAAKLEGRGDAPTFEFDRDTYKGVSLHLVSVDIPAEEDEMQKVLGGTARVHIGTSDKAVYVAIGDASVALMTQLIDAANGQPAPASEHLLQGQINLMPALQFAQSIEDNDMISAMIDALSRSDDGGSLRFISNAIDNGQMTRITLGDGLLRAIGGVIRQTQMNRMQNAGQF